MTAEVSNSIIHRIDDAMINSQFYYPPTKTFYMRHDFFSILGSCTCTVMTAQGILFKPHISYEIKAFQHLKLYESNPITFKSFSAMVNSESI